MAAATTTTTIAPILKVLYPAGEVTNAAMKNHVFMTKVPKVDDFTGSTLSQPIFYANPKGRASNFSDALANATGSYSKVWSVSRARDYGVLKLDAEAIRATKDNKGAFVEILKTEIDMIIAEVGNSQSRQLYGAGYGAIGQLTADTGTVMTFATAADAEKIAVGMQLTASPNADGTSPRSGTATVTKVNEDTGAVTYTGTISSLGTTDYIWIEGDNINAGGGTSASMMQGLASHLPLTAPTAGDSFYGVDRSADPIRLAGNRLDSTSTSIEENFLTLAEKCVRMGGRPNLGLLSHQNFSTFVKELGSKAIYTDQGGSANVGFRGIKVFSSAGPIEIFPDTDCPNNRGYLLQTDVWKIHHLDAYPHIVMDDGNKSLRGSDYDGIEVRVRCWGNLVCKAPGFNGVMSI